MTNGMDPSSRPRRTGDEELAQNQEIIRQHLAGGRSVRKIAKAVGLPSTSVYRVIQNYRAAQAGADDPDLDAQLTALLSKFEGGMKHTEVSCPEDIERLNDLEYFRLSSLPLDHPVRAHWQAAALRVAEDGSRW